ncbi:M15 family metallopeptidase [Moraxella nasovis]|uniref:M15 family metallopeptidase n=1 Tax=Moraxella nasovis TaxID=2904121 RepID=UPI001F616AAA|nr:M15 family metallopeptidase [Moraxella nasovis]UNU73116.1 M15 family metallopeptidase [Moraxella nasovis]
MNIKKITIMQMGNLAHVVIYRLGCLSGLCAVAIFGMQTAFAAQEPSDVITTLDKVKDEKSADLKHADAPICSPEALAQGIWHFSYDEASRADLVWSGFGDKRHANKKIHKDVKEPLLEMIKAAKKDKVDLYPASIFRSVKKQAWIVNDKIRKKQKPEQIYFVSSPAGFSEHHTGYAVDFYPVDEKFVKTKAYPWLLENAEKFGWEQTFTADYSKKSGVSEEAWHWRYVGDEYGKHLFEPRTCQSLIVDENRGVIDEIKDLVDDKSSN